MRVLAVALLPLALLGCAAGSGYPDKTEAALVVLRIEQAPAGFGPHGWPTALVLTRYDAASQTADTSVGSDVELRTVSNGMVQSETVAKAIRPGSYVISRFMVGEHWGLCLAEATYAFDVAPGQVLMLGRLDAKHYGTELSAVVRAQHVEKLSGNSISVYDFLAFNHVDPLRLDQTNADRDAAMALKLMAETDPGFAGPPAYAALRPAIIGNTGHPGIFFPRHCGELESSEHGRDPA